MSIIASWSFQKCQHSQRCQYQETYFFHFCCKKKFFLTTRAWTAGTFYVLLIVVKKQVHIYFSFIFLLKYTHLTTRRRLEDHEEHVMSWSEEIWEQIRNRVDIHQKKTKHLQHCMAHLPQLRSVFKIQQQKQKCRRVTKKSLIKNFLPLPKSPIKHASWTHKKKWNFLEDVSFSIWHRTNKAFQKNVHTWCQVRWW